MRALGKPRRQQRGKAVVVAVTILDALSPARRGQQRTLQGSEKMFSGTLGRSQQGQKVGSSAVPLSCHRGEARSLVVNNQCVLQKGLGDPEESPSGTIREILRGFRGEAVRNFAQKGSSTGFSPWNCSSGFIQWIFTKEERSTRSTSEHLNGYNFKKIKAKTENKAQRG